MSTHTISLDVIDVAEPCTVSWDEMTGDATSRHCAHCKLQVHDLSAMTLPEAEQFLLATGGNACVRFYRRADGTVVTGDCENAWRRVAKRALMGGRRWVCAVGAVLAAMLAMSPFARRVNANVPMGDSPQAGITPVTVSKPEALICVMGKIAPIAQPEVKPPMPPATQPATQPATPPATRPLTR